MADYQLLGGDSYGQGMEEGAGALAGYGASQDLVSPLMAANPMGSGQAQMGAYPQMQPAYSQQQGDVSQKMHYGAYGAATHLTPEYGMRTHAMGEAAQQSSMMTGYAQQALVGQRIQSATDQYPYGAMGAPQRTQDVWRGHYLSSGPGYQQHGDVMSAQHALGAGLAGQQHRTAQGQYAAGQEYSMHAPQQHGSPQRPAYGTQGNGPHVAQMTAKATTHLPDQTLASYPQTTYPSAQPAANRATYGTAGSMSHSAVSQSMPSRSLQRPGGYPTGSTSQPALPQGSPARMQQYPQSAYSPGHPFSGSDATSPSHLSPYPSQAPNSPQYRGSYPSPRRPTPTPPAGSPSVVTSQQSSSQGSYPSPGATHLSSPGQVLSPGSGGTTATAPVATSSLQQLEQMVMPHMAAAKTPSAATSSTSSYYGGTAPQQQTQPYVPQQNLGYPTMGSAQHHPYPGPSPSLMARARPLAGSADAAAFGAGDVGAMAGGPPMPTRSDYPMGTSASQRTAPMSPVASSYSSYPTPQPASSLGYEQAQQQLQHLYSVPQTAQTQKRVS